MSITRTGRLLVAVVVLVSCLGPAVPTAASSKTMDRPVATQVETPTNETSATNETRHIGPELPEEPDSNVVVLSRLESRIAARLVASTDAVEARQFDDAEIRLQGDTELLLQQYQEAAGDTPTNIDDETAERLNLTVQQQRELIEAARNSRSTYSQYQLARANGNETRARQLARELLDNATAGNRTTADLIEQYQQLNNTTEIQSEGLITKLEGAQGRLDRLRTTVTRETFVETNLTVTNVTARASPVEPLRVSGQLRSSENQSGLVNETIRLTLGEQQVETRTTANGTFSVSLRPSNVTRGTQTAVVQFVPRPTSIYAPDEVRRNVTVRGASPDASASLNRTRGQFDDNVSIRGFVSADGNGLSGVPIRASLGIEALGRTRTDANGTFDLEVEMPSTVEPGERQIQIEISRAESAARPTVLTRDFTVNSTTTRIRLRASQKNASAVVVTGRLVTADGTPLTERSVELSFMNTETTVPTEADGRFETTFAVSEGTAPTIPFRSKPLTVTASYAAGGNLEPTEQTATIGYNAPLSTSLRRTGYGGIIVALLVGGVVAWRRRTDRDQREEAGSVVESGEAQEEISGVKDVSATKLLERANQYAESAEQVSAVRLGYAALRWTLVERFDVSPALTHWELYRTLADRLDDDEDELLSRATLAYERAVYSDRKADVTMDEVEQLLASIEERIE